MRNQFLTIGLLFSSLAFAQNSAVTNAILANVNGDLAEAKSEIDKAAVHEKTSGKAKTWSTRGEIYENIFSSPKAEVKALAPDAAQQAVISYNKAMSLADANDEYHKFSLKRLENLWGVFLNDGVRKFEAKDFAGSIASYEMAASVRPSDTTAYVYSLYSAEALKDYEKCRNYTRKLFGLGKKSALLYISLARQARAIDKKDTALAIVSEGRKSFPADQNLALEELDLYFALGRGNEAKSKLEDAVKMDSTKASLYSILGNLYDQESNDAKRPAKEREASKQKALAAYKKAIKLEPDNMESNFNMGVYYFNRGAEILKKLNDLDINSYQKVGKKMEGDAQNEFKQALPYFETCYKKNPADQDAKRSLKNTYERVGRSADAEKLGN